MSLLAGAFVVLAALVTATVSGVLGMTVIGGVYLVQAAVLAV